MCHICPMGMSQVASGIKTDVTCLHFGTWISPTLSISNFRFSLLSIYPFFLSLPSLRYIVEMNYLLESTLSALCIPAVPSQPDGHGGTLPVWITLRLCRTQDTGLDAIRVVEWIRLEDHQAPIPPSWTGLSSSRSGCSGLQPTWPWPPPGMGYP